MSLRTTGSVLVVFLWSVTVVLCTNGWGVMYTTQSISALKGSTVNLSCSYMYPSGHTVTSTFWFINNDDNNNPVNLTDDPDYRGRVTYHNDKKNEHTLTITDLRKSDSLAKYKFRFITDQPIGRWTGEPGVTLSVTDILLQINPTSVSEGERVTLLCRTTYPLDPIPEYIWYKNKQPVTSKETKNTLILYTVTSEDAGNYSCAVKGRDDLRSPENTLNVIYGPKNTSVSVSPSGEIVEGSSVTLTCSSDANPPVDNYTWYKKNVTSPKASGQSYSITNIRSEDSGEYYCEAENLFGRPNSSTLFVAVHSSSQPITASSDQEHHNYCLYTPK
ncbi:hypothetical protein UPYG_G00060560 [Umbra pygmaea]|uniref:B-cell receptor CD22 n=1 Tax=Umbra pygmaea TaxID=75934 RepID=A0ABD0X992_UMBPY